MRTPHLAASPTSRRFGTWRSWSRSSWCSSSRRRPFPVAHRYRADCWRTRLGLQSNGRGPSWVKGRDAKWEDRQRAVYQMVISPDDWRGLDLRLLARTMMKQLEADAGSKGLGPWFAAEHRNTSHHHVQIVLAARREVA